MNGYNLFDIREASFEQFVDFLFDHEVAPVQERTANQPEPWYWNADVRFAPVTIACYYPRLFVAPEFLLERFDRGQIEQGLWAIQGCNLDCSASRLLWHKEVPFDLRADYVTSMYGLFDKLFSCFESEAAVGMWWDSLAYDWDCGNRARENGGEDERMQDVMFETLCKILFLPSPECQYSALHGLGHLHHPDTVPLIEAYLKSNPGLDAEMHEYAQAASRFDVM